MKTTPTRIRIYANDVQAVTGLSYRQSLRILDKVRKAVGKDKDDFITITDFCTVTKLTPTEVIPLIS